MKKIVKSVYGGENSKVGDFLVNRLLPGRTAQQVGPVVFLDHAYPITLKNNIPEVPTGEFAHPHRGIATFSYVLEGRLSHHDSRGHHDTISAGGVQWMKAGNGIIHDEQPLPSKEGNRRFHSLQFWINLPAKNKAEQPDYQSVHAEDIPEIVLPNDAGTLRILLGEFGSSLSPVTTFTRQFIYHLQLNPKSTFTMPAKTGLEYSAFVPSAAITVNGTTAGSSKLVIFDTDGDELVFENSEIQPADVLIFGGEPYTEPIVAQGPFVMNNHGEIAAAYRDFFDGKYGVIRYNTFD